MVCGAIVSWLEQSAAEDFEDYIGEVLYETDDVAWRHTLAALLQADPSDDLVKVVLPSLLLLSLSFPSLLSSLQTNTRSSSSLAARRPPPPVRARAGCSVA